VAARDAAQHRGDRIEKGMRGHGRHPRWFLLNGQAEKCRVMTRVRSACDETGLDEKTIPYSTVKGGNTDKIASQIRISCE
jgi:hypothetical protein